ncbi:sushi, von Willebrand factor type A, EGF and pentraxin domain-containing protein 1-like [Tigriopus californicus]|uniref:sushi, von Willebrand factor type A, EGF and pentraxin domain-containing protein 1-like n=1 Tax=Tigriopus californicus TaxID=6832 RepID=UPI0027DA7671|nr:sushi, von Willebrand factor type A, EGF and pentraxin domain-containing protein 1-like [Tigriopus californicus]
MTEDPARHLPTCVPYCFEELNSTNTPGNTTISYSLAHNTEGQEVKFTCKYGHEYKDETAMNALETIETNDDFLTNIRRKLCQEVVHPKGGIYVDQDPIPDSCYIINCTKNVPPIPPATGADWNMTNVDVDNNGLVPLQLNSVIEYRCTTRGKKFQASGSNAFVEVIKAKCQINKKWDLEAMTHTCEWAYCLNPPNPPDNHNLSLSVDPSKLIDIGADIKYNCEAGGHNRIKGDFNEKSVSLKCAENNVVEEPTSWPVCVPDITCPDPTSNAKIINNGKPGATNNFDAKVLYSCVDPQEYIKKKTDPSSSLARDIETSCDWDSENWTLNVDMLECEVAACIDFPVPPSSANMVRSSHVGETDVVFATKVEYSCVAGQFFSDQPTKANRSLSLECLQDTTQFQVLDTWPECKADAACAAPEASSEIIVVESIQDPNSYEATYNYRCSDQRFSISEDGSTFKDSIATQCQWNNQWSKRFASLSCILSHCWDFPVPPTTADLNRSTHLDEDRVPLGTSVTYTCAPNMYFKGQDAPENRTLDLQCQSSNGDFGLPGDWPECTLSPSCPNGPDYTTEIVSDYSTGNSINFESSYMYKCSDQRYSVVKGSAPPQETVETQCQWNQTWSVTSSMLSCELTHCWEYPVPPPPSNMNRSTHWNDVRVALGTKTTYECGPNMYFEGQDRPENRTLDLECLTSTGTFAVPDPWPVCVLAPSCPNGPPDAPNGISSNYSASDLTVYASNYSYSCDDPRMRIRDSLGSNISLPSITTTCLWNQQWSQNPAGFVCDLVGCNPPPDQKGLSMVSTYAPGTQVLLGWIITYECIKTPNPTYFDSDRSKKKIDLKCLDTGFYNDSIVWPTCVENIRCGPPIDPPIDGTISYLNNADFGDDNYGISAEYRCPVGKTFATNQSALTTLCQWNKTWTLTSLPECLISHCVNPPSLPTTTYLEDRLLNEMTRINQNRTYHCRHDSSFETDNNRNSFDLLCRQDGTFEDANWPRCVTTVNCNASQIPDIPVDGVLNINGSPYDKNSGAIPNIFQTDLEFFCGPSRKFRNSDGNLYNSWTITCQWNKSWTPGTTLDTCTWFQCLSPPVPPKDANLKLMNTSTVPTEFNDKVFYECNQGHWFEQDRSQTNFSLTCQTDGSFKVPLNNDWPKCVTTVFCSNPPSAIPPVGTVEVVPEGADYRYGTTVIYSCGTARHFYGKGSKPQEDTLEYFTYSSKPDFGTDKVYDFQEISCHWDKRWVPEPIFDDCIWTACMNPPTPPHFTYLKSTWDGEPIAFGKTAPYKCDDVEVVEYGEVVKTINRYFVSNRSRTTTELECLPNGNFKIPIVWPTCTDTINCYSYPARRPGMTWENPGERKFESIIRYGCGPLGRFSRTLPNGIDELYDVAEAKCEWNGKFQPETLDRCQASHCLGIPQPPPETLLVLLETNSAKVKEIIEENDHHWKRSTPREKPELSIPKNFCTDESYEYFYLYGSIPTDWNANFTTISFETTNDAALFVLQIYPGGKFVNRWSNRFKDDPTFKKGFVSSFDEGIVSTIDLDEPFELKVTCDTGGFYFIIEGDPSYPSMDHQYLIHTFELHKVVLEGTTNGIQYMAFVQEGVDPKVPVGMQTDFGCPPGYVLHGNYNPQAMVRVTCREDGTFGTPNWQTCVSVDDIMRKFQEGLTEDANLNGSKYFRSCFTSIIENMFLYACENQLNNRNKQKSIQCLFHVP